MSSNAARTLVADNITIPTLPAVVERINALLEDPNAGTREVGAEIAKDAPLSTRVLRIANSAAYGLRQRVVSTEQASAVLGMKVLRNLALQASVIGKYEHLEGSGFDINSLWKQSILTGQTCSSMSRKAKTSFDLGPDELYTCGLLVDIGQVVLLDYATDVYLAATQRASEAGRPLHEIEEELLGFSHAEIGARLALRWGLPSEVVSAIQFSHGPQDEVEADPTIALVELSSRLSGSVVAGDREAAEGSLDAARAVDLGLDQDAFAELVDGAFEALPSIEV
ncbi:MAG: HDOD domain-containing protein [Planctomycetota bacterium]